MKFLFLESDNEGENGADNENVNSQAENQDNNTQSSPDRNKSGG